MGLFCYTRIGNLMEDDMTVEPNQPVNPNQPSDNPEGDEGDKND